MTLDQWCKLSGVVPTYPANTDAVCVSYSRLNAYYRDMWRLSDYKVSTVSGPVVWLVPTNKATRQDVYDTFGI